MTKLEIKVVPGASSAGVSGWLGDALKIRVTAPPEKGRANREAESLLCAALGLAAGAIRVVSGRSAARKIVEVRGLSHAQIRQRLS